MENLNNNSEGNRSLELCRRVVTTESFIREAMEIYGDRYKYDKVEYKNRDHKVIVTCPIHGETEFSGNFNECIKCRRKRLKLIRKQQKEEQEMAINNTFCPFHGIKVNSNGRCPECDRLFNEIGFIL